jgi:hypothetical protein
MKPCKIGYEDGNTTDWEPFENNDFPSIEKAKKFLKEFFKAEPDEKHQHYFIYPKENDYAHGN